MKRKSTHITKETSELGYNIPQNYFDELEQSLLSKIKTENIENSHTEKLGFKVPDGYFESVNKAIIEQTKPKKGKLITLLLVHKYKISAIAAVLLVVFMVYNYNSAFKNSEKTIAISNDHLIDDALLNSMFIEDAKIEEYVDYYVVNELLIQDVLTNFIDLDDTTLSLLFEKDTTIDAYLDKYVTELLLEEI